MNVVLIGMPGCGKSTIGVLLAKTLLYDFIDTDLVIQNKYQKSLCDLIVEYGIDGFKKIENNVLSSIKCSNSIIATGGSAVYGSEAMVNLKHDSVVVYLNLSPSEIVGRIKNITTRGIAMEKGTTIAQLYNERHPLYIQYADEIIDCSGSSAEECVTKIKDVIKNRLV